jgi:predicted phage baseplate assembly protein
VRQQEDGTLLVTFGDGAHGRRLPTGANNVRVVYRQGAGSNGNLAAGTLSTLAKPHVLVKEAVQPIAASGGGARESTDAIRTNAAATLLALERAVSLEDFSHLARSQAAVAQARAFALAPGRGQRENLEVRIIPAGGAAFTEELGAQIRAFLLAHALPGVQLAVKGYDAVLIGFEVNIRVRREAFDADTVAANVRSALVAAFGIDRRELGQPLFRGEVLAVIEAVQGVENSDGFIVLDARSVNTPQRVVRDSDGHITTLRVFEWQCAHLPNNNPRVTITVQNFEL